ncbi:hypothetical protein HOF92_04475 [bacterium]|jgi:hypothetical protein|nr:hypothetical protein [bacterium]
MSSAASRSEVTGIPSRFVELVRSAFFLVVAGCAYSVFFYVLFLMGAILEPHIGLIAWTKSHHNLLVPFSLALILLFQGILLWFLIDLRTRVKRMES